MHEETGKEVHVVARDIECDGKDGAFLSILPTTAVYSSSCSNSTMELAYQAMVQTTSGLRRTH